MEQARADERRAALLASLDSADFKANYDSLTPVADIGFPFKPRAIGSTYLDWPLLPDLFPMSFPGIQPSRDDIVVDIDRERLITRMNQYFDPTISHERLRQIMPSAMKTTSQFPAEVSRDHLLKRGFLPQYIVRYCYRPFDLRWLYWEPETNLLDRKRADYFPHVHDQNLWLGATHQNRRDFDPPPVSTRHTSRHVIERGANLFPLYLKSNDLFTLAKPNLSESAATYLARLETAHPEDLFNHIVAALHAPAYRIENAGALRQDWPRIPLPTNRDTLIASAELGRQVAVLLDPECQVKGVTEGKIRGELKSIGVITRVGGGQLNPDTELAVTVGWGYAQGSTTMPGQGKLVQRAVTAADSPRLAGEGPGVTALSDQTVDVYLNDVAYWRNIPLRVWEYTIGGYQVIKKWLSYREHKLLGRPLSADEVRDVTNIARRIAAILLLEPNLDANYAAVKAATVNWADLRGPAS
jgi:type ISP restriction-modification system protein